MYAVGYSCEDVGRGSEPHDQSPLLANSPVEIKLQVLPVTLVDGYVMIGI